MGCGPRRQGKHDSNANPSGPENVITIRTKPGGDKSHQVPPSLGNKTWNVSTWTNGVTTSQYTWWNFLFLNLWQQILVPANFYFLVMAILQLIPEISDSGGMPTYLVPLAFVFVVTMIKDGWEDVKRHQSDREENERQSRLLTANGDFASAKWASLRPGDIVKVLVDEIFPADLVMLSCSDDIGCCYVETVQLDGETNMKTKTAIPEVHNRFVNDGFGLATHTLQLNVGPPSAKLYSFNGGLKIFPPGFDFFKLNNQLRESLSRKPSIFGSPAEVPSAVQSAPPPETFSKIDEPERLRSATPGGPVSGEVAQYTASLGQFLWRGAQLTNTAWVVGIVVYPGSQSRIFQNTRSRVSKYSGLMRSYNYNALALFVLQLVFCLVAGLLYANDVRNNQQYAWYLQPEATPELQGGSQGFMIAFAVSFGRWVLLMSYFIPITLLVQIEVCRWFHGFYINSDHHSYSNVTGSYPNVSTLSIMEDLGVITHVFSDKTGTLTQNIMQMKSFAIGGEIFGFDHEERTKEKTKDEGDEKDRDEDSNSTASWDEGNRYVDFDSKGVRKRLLGYSPTNPIRQKAKDFLQVLSVCHSVLPKATVRVERVDEQGSPRESVELLGSVRNAPSRFFSNRASLLSAADQGGVGTPQKSVTGQEVAAESTTPLDLGHGAWASSIITPKKEAPPTSTTLAAKTGSWKNGDGIGETPAQAVVLDDVSPLAQVGRSLRKGPQHQSSIPLSPPPDSSIPSSNSPSSVNHRSLADPTTVLASFDEPTQIVSQPHSHELELEMASQANLIPSVKQEERQLNTLPSTPPVRVGTAPALDDGAHKPASLVFSELRESSSLLSIDMVESPANQGGRDISHTALIPGDTSRSSDRAHPENASPSRPPSPSAADILRLRQIRMSSSAAAPPRIVGAGANPRLGTRRVHPHPQFIPRDVLEPTDAFGTAHLIRFEAYHQASQPEAKDDGVKMGVVRWKRTPDAQFDASSPDELALVAGAKHLGVEFLRRPDLNSLEVAILDSQTEELFLEPEEVNWIRTKREALHHMAGGASNGDLLACLTYEILEVLDFDNFRKRMSVIIRDRDGGIKLLCKGADSSMLPALASGQESVRKECEDCLAAFAREGLRTLVLGVRKLSVAEFDDFRMSLDLLRSSGIDDVERFAEAYSQIEKELTLVGCTGIDDKLQDQVPQTIEALKDAGIRVWVLTGDKVETAISIGHSSNLLTDTTYNAVIDGGTLQEVQKQMYEYMAFVVGGQLAKESFEQIILQQNQSTAANLMGSANAATVTVLESGTGPKERTDTGSSDEADEARAQRGCCTGCMSNMKMCCRGGTGNSRSKRRIGDQRNTATMNLNDFVSVLKKNAHHTKVVAPVDGRSQPKQLSAQEIEQLISVYVQHFGDQDEKRSSASKLNPVKLVQSSVKRAPTATNTSPSRYEENIETITQVVSQGQSPRQKTADGTEFERVEHYTNVAITVTGDALQHALSTDEARRYFFGLAHLCSTVIACRVTPKQKAEVVRQSARCTPAPCFTSLGIGDGANDVGMILTANVGVGILGKEGSQAARSADISIGEFKILRNLLFAHGHDITRRHSIMMYQTIYKNVLFAMSCWFAGLFSGFSASDNFDAYQKQVYNLLLTPWPICAVAVFDRALPYGILYQCASLYPIAMRPDGTRYFGTRWFSAWFACGIVGAGIIILFSWAMLSAGASDDQSGRTAFDWSSFGQAVFTLVVMSAIIPSIPFTHTIFWFTPLGFVICIGSCYALWALLNAMSWSDLQGSMSILHQNWNYHLMMLAAMCASMSIIFIWWRYRVLFRPTPEVIIRERIKKGVFDVVVAPRRRGELAVVVPRTHQRQRHLGFAHAPSETRFSLRRKSMNSFMGSQCSTSFQPPYKAGLALELIAEE